MVPSNAGSAPAARMMSRPGFGDGLKATGGVIVATLAMATGAAEALATPLTAAAAPVGSATTQGLGVVAAVIVAASALNVARSALSSNPARREQSITDQIVRAPVTAAVRAPKSGR